MTEQRINVGPFYRHFGLDLKPTRKGNEYYCPCPFCGSSKFAIVMDTGVYNCFPCGKSGNSWEFINDFHSECLKLTSQGEYQSLAARRGLKVSTLRAAKLAKSSLQDVWLIPSFSPMNRVANLYQAFPFIKPSPPCPPGKPRPPTKYGYEIKSAPFPCEQQLYGIDLLKEQSTIIICEGHWDRLAMWEILAHLEHIPFFSDTMPQVLVTPDYTLNDICVLAVPGANIFKSEWCKLLRDKHVVLVYDNDHDKVICPTCRGREGYKAHLKGSVCPLCKGTDTTGQIINPGRDGLGKVARELDDIGIAPLMLCKVSWNSGDPKDVRDVLCL